MAERRRASTEPAFRRRATLSLWLATAGAVVGALFSPGCLERRDEPSSDPEATKCTSCHGDSTRAGDAVRRAAPPYDLMRNTGAEYPGVGAHDVHLNASPTHGALACEECHVVPADVGSKGHADDGPPGDVTFGALAKTGDREPSYDAATRTCQSSYCHRSAWPVWSNARTSAEACGSCHGLPPAAPHPQSERCYACHGEVIDADRRFIAPERHVDGRVDYVAGDCRLCHGSQENAAPPRDTAGMKSFTELGVGAHQAHLEGGADGRPLECGECHVVPEHVEDPTHVDGLPAELTFTGVALTSEHAPSWAHAAATCSDTYCHGPSPGDSRVSPIWNEDQSLGCASCHGLPPPAPHPQSDQCSACHGESVGSDNRTILDKIRHVDGTVDVAIDATCTSCHGEKNAAPPLDAGGNDSPKSPGVGAHQTHVQGTERSRAVPCAECHRVPKRVLDEGHVDSARPAELVFSGVALANGAAPSYENGSCRSTTCHGAVFPYGEPSGGSNTAPAWTTVDGTEAACGSCHSIPPPPPHPGPGNPCHDCHDDIADDDVTFTRPEEHVDGIVTLRFD